MKRLGLTSLAGLAALLALPAVAQAAPTGCLPFDSAGLTHNLTVNVGDDATGVRTTIQRSGNAIQVIDANG
ncbi:MAG: hypothetical protein ACXWED_00995, partial [Solirubrobacterales bacterium]